MFVNVFVPVKPVYFSSLLLFLYFVLLKSLLSPLAILVVDFDLSYINWVECKDLVL